MLKKVDSKPSNPFKNQPAKILKTLRLPTGTLSVDVSEDGKNLFAACIDGGIYRVGPGKDELTKIGQHDRYASGVASINNGKNLVSAGYDGRVRWHESSQQKELINNKAHSFWSWQLAVNEKAGFVASSGGQYLCGGYKYEPKASKEPTVMLFELDSGRLAHALSHIPPVQSVTFSQDGQFVAAGNLMGEVRVWETRTGKLLSKIETPNFTGWGIIKGHYYTGGVFSLFFSPDNEDLYLAGMGTTRDPAAGNGRQLWQRFKWNQAKPQKVDETHSGESGSGLMETITLHPSGKYFVMGGRIAKGKWNVAFFDTKTGSIIHSISTRTRVTEAVFSKDGSRLYLSAAVTQPRPKDGKINPWGRIHVYEVPKVFRAF